MRRSFTMDDFLNCRRARVGDDLEFGRTDIPANMGGECDVVYGFWEHNRSIPVYVPDGTLARFNGTDKVYCVRYREQQIVLEGAPDGEIIKLIEFSFDPKDWGKPLLVVDTPSLEILGVVP